jgi:anti-anti-sigma factor
MSEKAWGIFMSVNQNVSFDGKIVRIGISGRFDYRVSKEFRDAYRHIPGREGIAYHVDLKDVDFMDSSALGMLLLLREHGLSRGGVVIIQYPSETIDKILRVANFEQLFDIEYLPVRQTGAGI